MSGVPHMMPDGPIDAQGTQTLFEHVSVLGQMFPQPPQLLWSTVSSTQVPAHDSCPAGHAQTPV
jgi:hypothetical protein